MAEESDPSPSVPTPSAFVLRRCDRYCPTEHKHTVDHGDVTFLDVLTALASLKYVWN